jgi:hypothetical protein
VARNLLRKGAGVVLLVLLGTGGSGTAQPRTGDDSFESGRVHPADRKDLEDGGLSGSPELWKSRHITTPPGGR